MQGYRIDLQIYADSEEEAAEGRAALISFIERMRQCGVAVRGSRLHEAVSRLDSNPFIKSQIVNFFK